MGNILISGASSGIGAALARRYAAPGAHLTLWGRNAARLEAVADDCRARGSQVATNCFDLADVKALVAALAQADRQAPTDIAIFNAGLGGSLPHEAIAHDVLGAAQMAMVNFTAPVVAANDIAARMGARGAGHIVLIGSIAALFPLPMAPVYSGSKAGLMMFTEALRARIKRYGVSVTLVSPGFIDTPMSQGLKEPRPFLISADQAAAIIKRKVARGARHIIVPWPFAVVAAIASLIPKALVRAVLSRF
jgi:short-subunit dehydrogenase